MLKLHRLLISQPWYLSLADQTPFFYALQHAIIANPAALLSAVGGVLTFTYGVYADARKRQERETDDEPSRVEQELRNRIASLENDKLKLQDMFMEAIEQRNDQQDHVATVEAEIKTLQSQIETHALEELEKEHDASQDAD